MLLHVLITGLTNYSITHFGERAEPTLLYNVACAGSESRLLDCSYGTYTSGATDTEDAGVRCLPCQWPCTQFAIGSFMYFHQLHRSLSRW